MRQDEVVIALEQHELMLQAVLALAQRVDATAHGRHALAKVQVKPLDQSGVDLPATRRKPLLNPLPGTEHDPIFHPREASTPVRLHHLGIEQLWQWPPALFRPRAFVLATLGFHPGAAMCQQCRAVILQAVSQKQGHTAWRYDLSDLMDHS